MKKLNPEAIAATYSGTESELIKNGFAYLDKSKNVIIEYRATNCYYICQVWEYVQNIVNDWIQLSDVFTAGTGEPEDDIYYCIYLAIERANENRTQREPSYFILGCLNDEFDDQAENIDFPDDEIKEQARFDFVQQWINGNNHPQIYKGW